MKGYLIRLGGGGCLTQGWRGGREEAESTVRVLRAKQKGGRSPAPVGIPACGFVWLNLEGGMTKIALGPEKL